MQEQAAQLVAQPVQRNLFGLKAGDRVTVRTAHGQNVTGHVQPLLAFADHVVLNIGGRYGRALVVTSESVIVRTQRRRGA